LRETRQKGSSLLRRQEGNPLSWVVLKHTKPSKGINLCITLPSSIRIFLLDFCSLFWRPRKQLRDHKTRIRTKLSGVWFLVSPTQTLEWESIRIFHLKQWHPFFHRCCCKEPLDTQKVFPFLFLKKMTRGLSLYGGSPFET
jgi:hypothetical protein